MRPWFCRMTNLASNLRNAFAGPRAAWLLWGAMLFLPMLVWGQESEAARVDHGDIAWMLIATSLVAMMTPVGLALFYGGMTPSRNVINTVGMSYMSYCIGSVVWVIVGYTLAFGTDVGGLIGNFDYAFLSGINASKIRGEIPELIFIAYQGALSAIAVALISGAIIERAKFSAWIVFTILWSAFVYAPIAHWVWGGGFLMKWGFLDFAGGAVIHISAGVSGLILAMKIGPRRKTENVDAIPHSIKFTLAGAGLLWFGWFGFNAGSALEANSVAANALLVTNISASLGVAGWMLVEWLFTGKYTMFGAACGTIAGLVAITPSAGYVNASSAMIIGLLGGLIGYFGVYELKKRTKIDDSLDVFGIHGLVGCWGLIAVGVFADPAITKGAAGLWHGNPEQLQWQLLGALVAALYAACATLVIYYITKTLTRGFRVDNETELRGIDSSFHGESAYAGYKL